MLRNSRAIRSCSALFRMLIQPAGASLPCVGSQMDAQARHEALAGGAWRGSTSDGGARGFAAQAEPNGIRNRGRGKASKEPQKQPQAYRMPWEHGKKSLNWQRHRAQSVRENNSVLRESKSLGEVLGAAARLRLSDMSPINVSTVLSKLAAFKAEQIRAEPGPLQSRVKALLAQLSSHIATGARGYPAGTLAFCLRSLRKLRVRLHDDLLKAADAEIRRRPREFSVQSVATLAALQTVAKRGLHNGALEEAERRVAASRGGVEVPPAALTELAWAFASAGRPSHQVFEALASRISRDTAAFSGAELATALWSCHTAGELTQKMLAAVVARVSAEPTVFKTPHLASIIHIADVSMGAPIELLDAAMPRLANGANKLQPQQLAFVSAAYASRANRDIEADADSNHDQLQFYQGLQASGIAQLTSFQPDNLAQFVLAIMELRGASEAGPSLMDSGALEHLKEAVPQLSANGLACAVHAFEMLAKTTTDNSNATGEQSSALNRDFVEMVEVWFEQKNQTSPLAVADDEIQTISVSEKAYWRDQDKIYVP